MDSLQSIIDKHEADIKVLRARDFSLLEAITLVAKLHQLDQINCSLVQISKNYLNG